MNADHNDHWAFSGMSVEHSKFEVYSHNIGSYLREQEGQERSSKGEVCEIAGKIYCATAPLHLIASEQY